MERLTERLAESRVKFEPTTSLTYGCLHSDQHGGEANCSCVWADRANRSSNWAAVSLRYRWSRSASRRSSWRRRWNSPSSVRLRRTSWTQIVSGFMKFTGGFPALLGLVQCSNGGDLSHDRRGKRAGWEIPVQKWAGKHIVKHEWRE